MIDNYLEIKSIDPKYWGRSGWIFLNSIALTFKPERKENYKLLIQQLPHILPCTTCGENLKKNMDTLDEALISKTHFLNWLHVIRNSIYRETYRNEKTLKENINEIFSNTNETYNYTIITTLLSFIVLIILILLFKYTS